MQTEAATITAPSCRHCGKALEKKDRGRPAIYCDNRCRKAAGRVAAKSGHASPGRQSTPAEEAARRREEMVRDGWWSIRKVGEHLGVGRDVVYGLLNSNQLPSVRLGGRRLIPRRAVDRMMADLLETAGGIAPC